jgi:hypothetical protein
MKPSSLPADDKPEHRETKLILDEKRVRWLVPVKRARGSRPSDSKLVKSAYGEHRLPPQQRLLGLVVVA